MNNEFPIFSNPVPSDGYAWWYVDSMDEEGQFGMTIIAFIGSVFSPYYAWRKRRDPWDHCALNVALYTPRKNYWSMTERTRHEVECGPHFFQIGPSQLSWNGSFLNVDVNEVTVPIPGKLRGNIKIYPDQLLNRSFNLDPGEQHKWTPISTNTRVEVKFDSPDLAWTGDGYFDVNRGSSSLESAFSYWNWSRTRLSDGTAILYDVIRIDGVRQLIAVKIDTSGNISFFDPPPAADFRKTFWRVSRNTQTEDGQLSVRKTLEDAPFYARSLLQTKLFSKSCLTVHETLDLRRFKNPIVKLMLPFRMPRHNLPFAKPAPAMSSQKIKN